MKENDRKNHSKLTFPLGNLFFWHQILFNFEKWPIEIQDFFDLVCWASGTRRKRHFHWFFTHNAIPWSKNPCHGLANAYSLKQGTFWAVLSSYGPSIPPKHSPQKCLSTTSDHAPDRHSKFFTTRVVWPLLINPCIQKFEWRSFLRSLQNRHSHIVNDVFSLFRTLQRPNW